MKHILMACGTGICTSSCVSERISSILDEHGFYGDYTITKCRMADVPALCASHDFLIATTMIPAGTLDIPFINGIPFLTGKNLDEATELLLGLMGAPECALCS